jgi:aspartyl-tRNA(Asn)/glutamyl-tRNA(Gln) amidotransferase subunit A
MVTTAREGVPENSRLSTAWEMDAALAAGEVSSVELVERALSDAERWQPSINAFSQLRPEEALEAARAADATPIAERPPLGGVPLAVKDIYDVAGYETTGCCAAYRGTVAANDAPTISRMRSAGLVLIGKTNQHEISAGATNLISACGRTGNPWDPDRITGGSSGGSGAAVAAGIVPFALGSDTGGSVRIPAAMCGAFGLKPTHGAVSIEGLLPHSPSLDCPGTIAWTAADLGAISAVLFGGEPALSDPPDPFSVRIAVPDGGYFQTYVRDDVLDAVDRVRSVFDAAGALISHVDGSGLEQGRRTWSRVAYPELASEHAVLFDRREQVDPAILSLLEYGRSVRPEVAAVATARRTEIEAWFGDRLGAVDALLVPTTTTPAPRADEYRPEVPSGGNLSEDSVGPGWLSCVVNLAGVPAVDIPAGTSAEGMPIGATLIGRNGEEERLLALAMLWDSIRDPGPERPSLP